MWYKTAQLVDENNLAQMVYEMLKDAGSGNLSDAVMKKNQIISRIPSANILDTAIHMALGMLKNKTLSPEQFQILQELSYMFMNQSLPPVQPKELANNAQEDLSAGSFVSETPEAAELANIA